MPVVALAAVGVVFVAIVAALLLLAAPAFVKLLQETVGRLPVVGGAIAGVLTSVFNSVTSSLNTWANAAVGAAATLVFGLVGIVWGIPAAVVDALDSLYNLAIRVEGRAYGYALTAISDAEGLYNKAVAYAGTAAAAVLSDAEALYNAAVAAANSVGATVLADAENLYNKAVAFATSAAAGVLADAEGLYNKAVAFTTAQIASVTAALDWSADALGADIDQAASKAEADLQAAVAGLEAYAGAQASGAVSALASELDQAAHDVVVGPWSALLPDVQGIVSHLPEAVAQSIPGLGALADPVPISLPGVLSLLTTVAAVTAVEVDSCAVPMCENLGGLSNLLGTLGGAAFWALVVALVAEAVADPKGAADQLVTDVAGPLVDLAHSTLSLVGA